MLNLRKSLSVEIHKNLPAVKEEYLVQPYCRRGLGEGGAIVTCCSQPGCNWNRETASGNIDINRSHIPSKLSHQLKIVTTPEIVPLNYFCLPIFQIYKLAGLRFIYQTQPKLLQISRRKCCLLPKANFSIFTPLLVVAIACHSHHEFQTRPKTLSWSFRSRVLHYLLCLVCEEFHHKSCHPEHNQR